MRKRPFVILFFSLTIMGISLSLPLQIIYSQSISQIFQMLTTLNMIVMLLCAATSVAVFKLHLSYRYLLPITFFAVTLNNWWVGYVGLNYSLNETSFASMMFLFLYGTLLEKNTRKVLLNPKLKWWETSTRYRVEIPVALVSNTQEEKLIKKTFDISDSGFFLTEFNNRELEQMMIGKNLDVSLRFSSILNLRCKARIVRKSVQNGTYPAGVGLEFINIDSETKSTIRRLSQEFQCSEVNTTFTNAA